MGLRYTKTADWEYIKAVAQSQDDSIPRIPVIGESHLQHFLRYHVLVRMLGCIHSTSWEAGQVALLFTHTTGCLGGVVLPCLVPGNGDIMSWTDFEKHKATYEGILEPCAMLARGALIKPWLPTEIKEQRHWDISASERWGTAREEISLWGHDCPPVFNIAERMVTCGLCRMVLVWVQARYPQILCLVWSGELGFRPARH